MKYKPNYNRKLIGDLYDLKIEDGIFIFKRIKEEVV